MSVEFEDEWRISILLLSNEFLLLYNKYHIYSTDTGELGKKVDSLINGSTSTEVSNIYKFLTRVVLLLYVLVHS